MSDNNEHKSHGSLIERLLPVLLIAGIGSFAFAFVASGIVPILEVDSEYQTLDELVETQGIIKEFYQLRTQYPEGFDELIEEAAITGTYTFTKGEARVVVSGGSQLPDMLEVLGPDEVWYAVERTSAGEILLNTPYRGDNSASDVLTFRSFEDYVDAYKGALKDGKQIYIAEGCWHCHSQFVRPVSNEELRFGPVSTPGEYQNEMHLPHLYGTRRVGPDLIRQHGVHPNDWHAIHFYSPTMTSPYSVMPNFHWLFNDDLSPNARGLALITYIQWLGSWTDVRSATAAGVAQ